MANFTRAKPAGYGPNSQILNTEIEKIDLQLSKAVNGDEGGQYDGDLIWTGSHDFGGEVLFEGEVQGIVLAPGAPIVAGTGEVTFAYYSKEQLSVPGNATTTAITIPTFPAVNQICKLRCQLASVVAVGASPHYGMQVWEFVLRRLAGSLVSQSANPVDVTTSGANLEHDIVVADNAGGINVRIQSSASSSTCNCNLLVEAMLGPTFALS